MFSEDMWEPVKYNVAAQGRLQGLRPLAATGYATDPNY